MSRGQAVGNVAILLVLCLVVGSIVSVLSAPTSLGLATISAGIARGIGIFLISSIIPLIWLALLRFSPDRSSGPLATWLVLALMIGAFNAYDARTHTQPAAVPPPVAVASQQAPTSPALVMTDEERNAFRTMFHDTCMTKQEGDVLNRQLGIEANQLEDYCNCVRDKFEQMLTVEEARYMVYQRKASAELQAKLRPVSQACAQAALHSAK